MNRFVLVLSVLLALTACGESHEPRQTYQPQAQQDQQAYQYQQPQYGEGVSPQPQVVYQQAPQAPVVVQSAPSGGGHDGTDMLMAGAIGYMMGNNSGIGGGNNRGYSTGNIGHTVINKTTIVNNQPRSTPRVNTYTKPRTSFFGSSRSSSSFGSGSSRKSSFASSSRSWSRSSSFGRRR